MLIAILLAVLALLGITLPQAQHTAAAQATTSDSATTTAARIAAAAVTALTAERATALSDNGSPSFPTAINQALTSLPFRSSPDLVRVDLGVPLAAIAQYLVNGDPAVLTFAESSIDTLLSCQQQPDGALFNTSSGAGLDTMFFADHLGMAVFALGDRLDAGHRASWTAAVVAAARYLVASGNLHWYTNGNIAVGNALTMALAWRLTGSPEFYDDYETALQFAINPPQDRWPGFGFVVTKAANNTDGSDGSGYFTEAGATGPGYDGDYSQLQDEQLSRLFLVTNDPQVLKLLNMVTNQLLWRTDTTTWMTDSSGGTRHNYPHNPFDTSALAVLTALGRRTDLAGYVNSQLAATVSEFTGALRDQLPLGDRDYYALGMIPLSIVMAGQLGVLPPAPPVPTSSATPPRSTSSAPVGTAVTLSVPVRQVAGRAFEVRGVVRVAGGRPAAGVAAVLYEHTDKTASRIVAHAVSTSTGQLVATVSAPVNSTFIWIVPTTARWGYSHSNSTEVLISSWVSLRAARASTALRRVSIWGTASVTGDSSVDVQRWAGHGWVTVGVARLGLRVLPDHRRAYGFATTVTASGSTMTFRAYRRTVPGTFASTSGSATVVGR
jgi:hypothetical protein